MTDLSAFSLEGKRVLVTGANTGIGQGIAVSVAKAGGAVIGVGRSAMDETAAKIAGLGGVFEGVNCDLGDHAAAQTMLDGVWERRARSTGWSTMPASSAAPMRSISPRPTGTPSWTSI